MYGLPSRVSLSFLEGRTLLQVCIGLHDLILNFDGDTTITVCSSIGYSTMCGEVTHYVDFRQSANLLCMLLGKSILVARNGGGGTMALEVVNESTLYLYDDSADYESYMIKHGDQLIVV